MAEAALVFLASSPDHFTDEMKDAQGGAKQKKKKIEYQFLSVCSAGRRSALEAMKIPILLALSINGASRAPQT
jgi:hypothetical protein